MPPFGALLTFETFDWFWNLAEAILWWWVWLATDGGSWDCIFTESFGLERFELSSACVLLLMVTCCYLPEFSFDSPSYILTILETISCGFYRMDQAGLLA